MAIDSLDTFRRKLKETREKKGITLKELAEAVGCKEATMQRYESGNGIKSVPYDVIIAIAKYLNVSPSYLMGWEENLKESTDFIPQLMKDAKMIEHVKLLLSLDASEKKTIYDMIEFLAKKKGL